MNESQPQPCPHFPFNLTIHNISYHCEEKINDVPWTYLTINDVPCYCAEFNPSFSALWQDPIVIILRVQALVIIAAALLAILVVFGSCRRRSGNSFLKVILFIAYAIPSLLVPYTIGLMESVDFKNSLFVVWTMFLILVLGSASSISAFTLDDNEHWKRSKILQLVQLFWACWLLLPYASDWKLALPVALILFLSGFKLADTREAFRLASLSNGVASNTKLVADFMHQEHIISNNDCDPKTMRGYNYLVAGDEQEKVAEAGPPEYLMKLTITDRVITVDKIWNCQGNLLRSRGDHGLRMKDKCLSFALFKLLRRRFAGYQLAEADKPKTWDFVRHGLLSGDNAEERAFRVIEVELAFLYDSFYTTYPVIFSRWFKMLAKSCLMLLVSFWVIAVLWKTHPDEKINEEHTILDIDVTYAMVLSMMSLELWQIIAYVLSDWAKVLAICKYVEKPSLQRNSFYEKLVGFMCRPRRIFGAWSRKLGQYSLVDSYGYCPGKSLLRMEGLFLVERTRKGQRANRPINLPKDVKKAIVSCLHCLQTTGGKLSNGLLSLDRNGVSESFSWACMLETLTHTHTHTILVWHIATEICQDARAIQRTTLSDHNSNVNVIVASSLSRYCAYLIAFVPELLPDHKFVTSCIFDNVVKEAREHLPLAGCKKREKKFEKLREAKFSEDTIMGNGAKLGRQLLDELEEGERWKVLADFWAEMMLYLAPSENSKAHAERLAQGGEFITHLWALLSHAGILQRDEASPAVQGAQEIHV